MLIAVLAQRGIPSCGKRSHKWANERSVPVSRVCYGVRKRDILRVILLKYVAVAARDEDAVAEPDQSTRGVLLT